MTAYRIAIDLTTRTIDRRAKYFRNLIVAVVLLSLGSTGWAMFAWATSPLSGFFLLFPVCGLFFFIDGKLLNDWRFKLLESWVRGEIDFRAFHQTVGAIPSLPKNTLQGMLDTLPLSGDLLTEQEVSSSTREAIAAVVTTIHACRSDAVAVKTAAFAIAGGSLILAVMLWTWYPFFGILAVAALPWLRKWMRLWRLRRLGERILAARCKPDFNQEKYLALVVPLRWEPILASEKGNFLEGRSKGSNLKNTLYRK